MRVFANFVRGLTQHKILKRRLRIHQKKREHMCNNLNNLNRQVQKPRRKEMQMIDYEKREVEKLHWLKWYLNAYDKFHGTNSEDIYKWIEYESDIDRKIETLKLKREAARNDRPY